MSSESTRPLVLVVDDDDAIRLLCSEALRQAGLEVAVACDGEEAIASVRARVPDLLLLDVMMPRLDGIATLERIRTIERLERLPVIMATGLTDTDSITRAYDAGATDFITKPLNWPIVCERVRYALRTSRMTRQLAAARADAVEAVRARTEFVGNVSHELRTPLNGILGMTHVLLQSDLSEDQRQCGEAILGSAHRLERLVGDVLDFSKIETGRLAIVHESFDPRSLTRDLVDSHRGSAEEKGLKIDVSADEMLPDRVVGDGRRIAQIVFNLLHNAIRFTSSGHVSVAIETVSRSGRSANIAFVVADTGCGISEDRLPSVFNAFEQVDGSNTRQHEGCGLGLSISRQLAELMGGSVRLSSRVDIGTEASLEVPLQLIADAADEGPDSAPATPTPPHRLRILVADDQPVNRVMVARMLERSGHSVICVENGRQCVEAFEASGADVILMDLQMPEMDGFEASRRIRELESTDGSPVPIIALTAHAVSGYRERCFAAGMNEFLTKPFTPEVLRATIDRVARERANSIRRNELTGSPF